MSGRVGVDIGGSGVRAAVVDPSGQVGEIASQPLHDRGVDAVIAAVRAVVGPLEPDAVGVGVPGFVRRGTVVASPNFPTWAEVPLADRLRDALGVPVAVENDANAAALGAWKQRGARGDLVLLTLGTGVGGGVVSEGRLLRGQRGTAGELGHVFAGGDAPCGCGGRGCLETWSSTVGLVRLAREAGVAVGDGGEVVRRAEAGEPWAIAALDAAAHALGRGLVTLVNAFAPDEVAIAGGLSEARRWWAPAERLLAARAIPANLCPVVWLGRADSLAIAGAASAVDA